MPLKTLFFLLFASTSYLANAQRTIQGIVLSKETGWPIPYVNIGIANKNIGTVSNASGVYLLSIPDALRDDSVTFTIGGFNDLRIPVLRLGLRDSIKLTAKVHRTDYVQITARNLEEKKFGITRVSPAFHFTDASVITNDVYEIAKTIDLDSTPAKITSVNLYINDDLTDSVLFRINFYSLTDNRPHRRLIEESIVFKKKAKQGWLKFDLRDRSIYLANTFVAAVELIPVDGTKAPVTYSIKPAPQSESFVRTGSQGGWSVPPHNYCIFVTALVKVSKNRTEENDEDTFIHKKIYSEHVRDSFTVFVKLPRDYTKNKRKKYGCVYLTDANFWMAPLCRVAEKEISDKIVVGIGYDNIIVMDSLRDRDFTYPVAPAADSFAVSGGGERFLLFMRTELIPYIEKNYRTGSGDRTLMGHSLGGYFTLFALENQLLFGTNTFQHFVAGSPSFHYAAYRLRNAFANLPDPEGKKYTLVVSYGGLEDEEDPLEPPMKPEFDAFCKLIEERFAKGIILHKNLIDGMHHMQTGIPTFLSGLSVLRQ